MLISGGIGAHKRPAIITEGRGILPLEQDGEEDRGPSTPLSQGPWDLPLETTFESNLLMNYAEKYYKQEASMINGWQTLA